MLSVPKSSPVCASTRRACKVTWRSAADLPPAGMRPHTPYDPDARYGGKRMTSWHGYKVHPMGPYYQAFPEGGSLTIYEDDPARTYEQLAKWSKKDADA